MSSKIHLNYDTIGEPFTSEEIVEYLNSHPESKGMIPIGQMLRITANMGDRNTIFDIKVNHMLPANEDNQNISINFDFEDPNLEGVEAYNFFAEKTLKKFTEEVIMPLINNTILNNQGVNDGL